MIGTKLVEEFVQSIAMTHRLKYYPRASALLIAAPESGKTTIASAARSKHVSPIAVMSGRSILKEIKDNPDIEFLAFNDLTCIRAMSSGAVALVINILNQVTQDERGKVAFAGKDDVLMIERPVGIIACIPHETLMDHRAKWMELGFVSRMIPFAYSYNAEIVATIKRVIGDGSHAKHKRPRKTMPKNASEREAVTVRMSANISRSVRALSDARALELKQIGIRLLTSYHSVIRGHALLCGRRFVTESDLEFLRAVDHHVTLTECPPLVGNPS